MIVDYHRKFNKSYQKLGSQIQIKVKLAIKKFIINPFDPSLRNYALHGRLQGKRAFWVTGDIRVMFEECNNYCIVIMVDVGTHNQIY